MRLNALILTAKPNLTTRDTTLHLRFFKIYEAHYLTWTAGLNLTTKEKTLHKSYFYDSLSLTKTAHV
jgi:hypothetical protein